VIGDATLVYRILIAAGLGAAIGFERERKDRPAGLRTHVLVALGACLFTVVSAYGFEEFVGRDAPRAAQLDPSRIASQIVVGIGFLGGGTILRYRGSIRGLTTAATLWVTAAVGLAVGAGAYIPAVVVAGVSLVALIALGPVERRARAGYVGSRARPNGDEDEDDTAGPAVDRKGWIEED
jgi:putative Mg2+ transporter-C (MgtC) family protein